MPHSSYPKSCRSHPDAAPSGGEVSAAARQRLHKRATAAQFRASHDFLDTMSAARRRRHPDKQTRLMIELRAMLREVQAALNAGLTPGAASAPSRHSKARAKRGGQRR
jgi:hypothetical protein